METAAHPHGLSVACQWRPHGRDDGDTPRCWPIGHRGTRVRARESDREPRDQPHGLNQSPQQPGSHENWCGPGEGKGQ